jgi:hypothetical protein
VKGAGFLPKRRHGKAMHAGGGLVPGHVPEPGATAAAAPAHGGGLGAPVRPRGQRRHVPRVPALDGRVRLAVADEGGRFTGEHHNHSSLRTQYLAHHIYLEEEYWPWLGRGGIKHRAPCLRLTGSCLYLASPTWGRILAAFSWSSSAEAPCLLAGKA